MTQFIKYYLPHILLVSYLVEFAYLSIDPFDRLIWFIENLPVVVVVALLIITFKKFRFSNFSYILTAILILYHTVGAHFTFALTPFELGNTLLQYLNCDFFFPDGRNNFDRVGHYLVGISGYPIAELMYRKKWIIKKAVAIIFSIFAIGFLAASYEIIETIIAVFEGGDVGLSFLGSQGDIWDAQKDMLLDIIGAITASALFLMIFKNKRLND